MIFKELLDKFAHLKLKYLRADNSKIYDKGTEQSHYAKNEVKELILEKKTSESKAKDNKQRNLCVSLSRKAKKNYWENHDLSDVNAK